MMCSVRMRTRRALTMGTHENVRKICEYLQALGFSSASERIQEAASQSFDDPLALVSLALDTAVTTEKNAKYEKCLRISKLGDPVFLRDLLTYKVRQLDLEYIGRLGELHFIQEHKNLIIWGAPGTGKTWMGKAIATRACQEGIRTKWVTYPFLCREKFLMQEFFNQAKIAGHSTIVSGQCSPENWDSLFEVKSFAQSIRGRLLEHAYRLELKGPDLRTYTPDVP